MAGKSIMDLQCFLDDLSAELALQHYSTSLPFLSIEIMIDKTWRISEHIDGADIAKIICSSEDLETKFHEIDVYDLLYMDVHALAFHIINMLKVLSPERLMQL